MNREVHVRFWESVEVRFPRATRLPAGLRNACGAAGRTGPLLHVLQHPAPSLCAGPTHTGGGIFRPGEPRVGRLKPREAPLTALSSFAGPFLSAELGA